MGFGGVCWGCWRDVFWEPFWYWNGEEVVVVVVSISIITINVFTIIIISIIIIRSSSIGKSSRVIIVSGSCRIISI